MKPLENTLCASAPANRREVFAVKTERQQNASREKWKPTCTVGRQIETKHPFDNVLQKRNPEKL